MQESKIVASLVLEDGSTFTGHSFGATQSIAGEVVFNTGMVGYPETLSDPSYYGQILVLTYPLIGNYGVPASGVKQGLSDQFESSRIQISGLVVANYSAEYSHWGAVDSLGGWLQGLAVPGISGIDTRALTKKLREQGTMLGKIQFKGEKIPFYDPNEDNLVERVSIDKPIIYGDSGPLVILVDCGCKHNIVRSLLRRGLRVKRVPWDYNLRDETFDGVMISNGPGDPKMYRKTINQIRHALSTQKPVFGICLGHQLLALAAGANTYKLKYGHRSQNQPVIEAESNRCMVTSQNHGFAVDHRTIPEDWLPWFTNLNDGTNEGLRHRSKPFMSVQFHPEAAPGPIDAGYLFDEFAGQIDKRLKKG